MDNSVAAVLNCVKRNLKQKGIDTWNIDGELLVCKATGLTRVQLVTHDMDVVTLQQLDDIERLLQQRLSFKPMQYILGKCEFMGMEFEVNENTLIPRCDTEILVETVINEIKNNGYISVIDIGTGSGAIAVSVGKLCPEVSVTAVDVSVKALSVAKKNADNNAVNNITFVQSNIFEGIEESYDVIVSNPPYIETHIIETLDSQVKDYEPVLALDGGTDGLNFYRKISSEAKHLNKNGVLAFEIGYNQGQAVMELMNKNGFVNIRLIKDLAGLDRVVIGNIV